ncbi:MAG: zf-HC2 domain-containing protein [Caldilineales bacterium]|nr:zf-HC2 domain-containing protein [Caldilineales bacterium]MDW8318004.1 zf-HC2 domain-containing protein [Anaerolineae bacterium]
MSIFRPNPSLSDELLSAYLDGRLSHEQRRRVEERLAADPEAARRLRELRYTVQTLRAAPRAPVPRAFTLREAAAQRPRRRGWPAWLQPVHLRGAAAALAMALVLLLVGSLALPGSGPAVDQGGPVTAQEDASAVSAKGPAVQEAAELAPTSPADGLGLAQPTLWAVAATLGVAVVVLLLLAWRMDRPV